MPRKKKGDPELNLVSFCDIVTVSTVALFMAMIIVIDQAMRTPVVRPTPLALSTTNTPVYFECRGNQVYYIDRQELAEARTRSMNEMRAKVAKPEDMLQTAMQQDIGNRYYRFDNSFLVMGIMALNPRKDVPGVPVEDLEKPDSWYQQVLTNIHTNSQYVVYLVRDDSFPAYRKVRDLTALRGLLSGWEYIGRDEVITFEGMFAKVKAE